MTAQPTASERGSTSARVAAPGDADTGCSVPTSWCSHNDPSYSGTEHGALCFAMTAMTDFFASLP
jgi:hypothetical protein